MEVHSSPVLSSELGEGFELGRILELSLLPFLHLPAKGVAKRTIGDGFDGGERDGGEDQNASKLQKSCIQTQIYNTSLIYQKNKIKQSIKTSTSE